MNTNWHLKRKFEFTDILGWSFTRFSSFSLCKRRYYYDYYGKWDVNNHQKIKFLKNLTTIPLEIGNVSHKLIHKTLVRLQKKEGEINRKDFFDYARRRAQEIISRKIFEEVYYQDLDEVDFENHIYGEVEKALSNFLESHRFQWINEVAIKTKTKWYLPSENDEDKEYGECRINHLKTYCKVDFMFPVDDQLYIIDWKTGKIDKSKHNIQLVGYAGWANFHFDWDYSNIKPLSSYLLPEFNEIDVEFNDYDIDDFADRVKRETEQMYEYCEVPETNTPIEKEKFMLTNNKALCSFCKYRELCGRN